MISLLIVMAFTLSLIPSLLFLWQQWKVREKNGLVKILRTHITHWVASFSFMCLYLIMRRGFLVFDKPFESDWADIVSLIVFSVMAYQTWKNYFLFKKISDNE